MEEATISFEELNPKSEREFWVSHIQAWGKSSLYYIAYCRQNDLKMHRWWYWLKKNYTFGYGGHVCTVEIFLQPPTRFHH